MTGESSLGVGLRPSPTELHDSRKKFSRVALTTRNLIIDQRNLKLKTGSSHKFVFLGIILLLGVGLDQLSKYWIAQTLPRYAIVPVIPDFFNLVHVYNRGAAFGLLSTWSPDLVRYFFIVTNLTIVAVLGYLYWRTGAHHRLFLWGYSLLISGALGNLIDRVRMGEVLDFLDFYAGRHHWPAFNVADSLICIGAGFLFLAMWRSEGEMDVSRPV